MQVQNTTNGQSVSTNLEWLCHYCYRLKSPFSCFLECCGTFFILYLRNSRHKNIWNLSPHPQPLFVFTPTSYTRARASHDHPMLSGRHRWVMSLLIYETWLKPCVWRRRVLHSFDCLLSNILHERSWMNGSRTVMWKSFFSSSGFTQCRCALAAIKLTVIFPVWESDFLSLAILCSF